MLVSVGWYIHSHLFESIGNISAAEAEQRYYLMPSPTLMAAQRTLNALCNLGAVHFQLAVHV